MKTINPLVKFAICLCLGTGLFSFSAIAQNTQKLTDPEIASVAVTANQIDIQYAEIAIKRSHNKQVIDFAKTMARDHGAVIKQAVALAQKLGVTPKDNNPTTKAFLAGSVKTKAMLNSKRGKAFDKAYVDNEVAYHKAAINEVGNVLIEILIRRYDPFLYKIGRTYHYNHEDTEDLMQDAYINAYCSLKKFENRSSFKTWLTRIMLNLCYQKKQKLSNKNEFITSDIQSDESSDLFQYSISNEKITMNKELGHVLENAIHSIPEDYRIVFTLRELNGLSVAETSEALSITESNVKVRLNRAKGMLQKEVKKMYSPQEIFEFNLIYCDVMVNRVMNKIYELREAALKGEPLN